MRAQRVLRAHLPELRERYAVKSLGIFGSYARGAPRQRSDLDVLVEFERTPTLLEFVRLKRYLSQLTGIPVDLVLKKTLKPHIGRYILAEVIPVE
ncbi:MAG: nucleotidyltransferase family protein [Anaerolineae bacterium]|nr:nucleotidyltransferase family protein [Anaerolineae bacterium]